MLQKVTNILINVGSAYLVNRKYDPHARPAVTVLDTTPLCITRRPTTWIICLTACPRELYWCLPAVPSSTANLILSKSSGWRRSVDTTPPDMPAIMWRSWTGPKRLRRAGGQLLLLILTFFLFYLTLLKDYITHVRFKHYL
jgi:hypothetical protein